MSLLSSSLRSPTSPTRGGWTVNCSAPIMVGAMSSGVSLATVIAGTSVKCWQTMPRPSACASFGFAIAPFAAADQDVAFSREVIAHDAFHQRALARTVM